ncbi:gamma-glutamylcyclotransferase-like isoform X1 [Centruroides vittatus]|uniref:gamma-glutamylcyclotransferase-like isoform X1 n=2 Tax=Centruroides vittatus TaxID=120091 RepID=UPI00350EDA9D
MARKKSVDINSRYKMNAEKDMLHTSQDKIIFYFAYGSNLSSDRLKINNPSAVKNTIGKLKGYELSFQGYSDFWKGATANITENKSCEVWGTVWQLPENQIINLDKQEAGYNSIQVRIKTIEGKEMLCKTYQMPEKQINKPSTIYKAVIVYGAVEQNLPAEYINKLKNIEDNGYKDSINISIDINKILTIL